MYLCILGWSDSDVIEQEALFATVDEMYVEMEDMLIKYLLGVNLKISISCIYVHEQKPLRLRGVVDVDTNAEKGRQKYKVFISKVSRGPNTVGRQSTQSSGKIKIQEYRVKCIYK